MGEPLDPARVALDAQRARVRATAERLESAVRRTVDLRARVRQNPLQTAALAAGAAFLVLGGPRRTVRLVRRALRGERLGDDAYRALPGPLRSLVDASASGTRTDRDEARRQLALALHDWREDPKNRRRAARLASETLTPPGPSRAFWAFVEIAAVTAGGILIRRALSRGLTGGREGVASRQPAASAPERAAPASAAAASAAAASAAPASTPPSAPESRRPGPTTPTPATGYSGWSGQRRAPTKGGRPAG